MCWEILFAPGIDVAHVIVLALLGVVLRYAIGPEFAAQPLIVQGGVLGAAVVVELRGGAPHVLHGDLARLLVKTAGVQKHRGHRPGLEVDEQLRLSVAVHVAESKLVLGKVLRHVLRHDVIAVRQLVIHNKGLRRLHVRLVAGIRRQGRGRAERDQHKQSYKLFHNKSSFLICQPSSGRGSPRCPCRSTCRASPWPRRCRAGPSCPQRCRCRRS